MNSTATAAAKAIRMELGVCGEPQEVPELRRDFIYPGQMRRTHERIGIHVRMVIFGAVTLAALGAF